MRRWKAVKEGVLIIEKLSKLKSHNQVWIM